VSVWDKLFPLSIFYAPQPDCKQCLWHFYKKYENYKGELLAVYLECILGKLVNLELCNEYSLKEAE